MSHVKNTTGHKMEFQFGSLNEIPRGLKPVPMARFNPFHPIVEIKAFVSFERHRFKIPKWNFHFHEALSWKWISKNELRVSQFLYDSQMGGKMKFQCHMSKKRPLTPW